MRKWRNNSFKAAAILAGTAIGAGIFSLPYVFSKTGWGAGTIFLLFFAGVYFFVHIMFGAVSEADGGAGGRFFYLAGRYLPGKMAKAASLTVFGELIFSLVVYLNLAPVFSGLIFGGGGTAGVFIFWFFGSVLIFLGARKQGLMEIFGVLGILIIVGAVVFSGKGGGLALPAFSPLSPALFFLPFGPLLFSFAARPAISEMVEARRETKKTGGDFSLNGAIFLGMAITAFVYLVFVFGMGRLFPSIPPDGFSGLIMPPFLRMILGGLGLFTILTSYFILGDDIRKILRFDMKASFWTAAAAPVVLPILIYLLGFRSFFESLSFAGGVLLALEGVFIVFMWQRAFPKHRYRFFAVPLYIVFAVSLVYTGWSLIIRLVPIV